MSISLITRQVQARVFLDLLNHTYFHRVFNLMGTEYIAEYKIENNSLTVKTLDRLKIQKFKAGKLLKSNAKSITNLGNKKFPLGRFNTIEISKLLNALNMHLQFRSRMGFKDSERISRIVMYGQKSVVLTGYNEKELERENDSAKNQQSKVQPVIQAKRGSR
jgi:hypothetical protein